MGRKASVILRDEEDFKDNSSITVSSELKKLKPRSKSNMAAKIDVKQLRINLKEAKAEAAATKRDVTDSQKVFLADTSDKEATNNYRTAVSSHIKAAKAQGKAQDALGKALDK